MTQLSGLSRPVEGFTLSKKDSLGDSQRGDLVFSVLVVNFLLTEMLSSKLRGGYLSLAFCGGSTLALRQVFRD